MTYTIEQIKELCEKATVGTWLARRNGDCSGVAIKETWRAVTSYSNEDDASFIAAARTAIPELIAHIESLEQDLRDRYATIQRMRDTIREYESEAKRQPCGHLVDDIVSGEEGTHYCGKCENEAKREA